MPRLTQSEADRIMSLPLDEILHQRGYFYKKEKNSRNYLVMSNESGDTINIYHFPLPPTHKLTDL